MIYFATFVLCAPHRRGKEGIDRARIRQGASVRPPAQFHSQLLAFSGWVEFHEIQALASAFGNRLIWMKDYTCELGQALDLRVLPPWSTPPTSPNGTSGQVGHCFACPSGEVPSQRPRPRNATLPLRPENPPRSLPLITARLRRT